MRARLYPFPAKGLMRINEITSCSIIKNDDDCFKKLIKYYFVLRLWRFSAGFLDGWGRIGCGLSLWLADF